jgi:transmembrane sensor
VKHLLGEATPEEAQRVAAWLAEDALHLAHYSQLRAVWEQSRLLAATSTADENAAWQRFQQRIQEAAQTPAPVVSRSRFPWMKIAASIVLIFGLAWLGYTLLGKKAAPKEIFVQSRQAVLNDTLPDNSIVTLNKNASITYLSAFKGNTRKVALRGEAFFSVTPDKAKPFIINVNDIQVTVVGTEGWQHGGAESR